MAEHLLKKCIRDDCLYFKHSDGLNSRHGDYCCKGCKISGIHGKLCEKLRMPNSSVQEIFTLSRRAGLFDLIPFIQLILCSFHII